MESFDENSNWLEGLPEEESDENHDGKLTFDESGFHLGWFILIDVDGDRYLAGREMQACRMVIRDWQEERAADKSLEP